MKKENIKDIKDAIKILKKKEIVIFPTETAYGIAADARSEEAVEKVYKAKKRPKSKGLTVICSSIEQAEIYGDFKKSEKRIVEKLMPGPLTLVTESKGKLADNLNDDFVFRISSSEMATRLAEEFPITATSANISGEKTNYSVETISEELLEQTGKVLDVGELDSGPTSTIAEIVDGKIVTHREGPIKSHEIEEVIK